MSDYINGSMTFWANLYKDTKIARAHSEVRAYETQICYGSFSFENSDYQNYLGIARYKK